MRVAASPRAVQWATVVLLSLRLFGVGAITESAVEVALREWSSRAAAPATPSAGDEAGGGLPLDGASMDSSGVVPEDTTEQPSPHDGPRRRRRRSPADQAAQAQAAGGGGAAGRTEEQPQQPAPANNVSQALPAVEDSSGTAVASANGTDVALGEEQLFGRQAVSRSMHPRVKLELRLHNLSLGQLHKSTRNSVAEFLVALEGELCRAEGQGEERIYMSGIFGRYTRRRAKGTAVPHEGTAAAPPEEVVVLFEASTSYSESLQQVVDRLLQRLGSPDPAGALASRFAFALRNVSLSPQLPGAAVNATKHAHRADSMSAMALPLSISAAFTGVLVWLAAY